MRLAAFGGDGRMDGALGAARRAGWETEHVTSGAGGMEWADAVMLPWPRSFDGGRLAGTDMTREEALAALPRCRAVLCGGGVGRDDLPAGTLCVRPQEDETFLLRNAALTAEGAIFSAMSRRTSALAGGCCLITGYGRIGQALVRRLCALEMFVIVCARSEAQMRAAHAAGAHPVPLEQIESACAQAQLVMNTVPAHVLGRGALERLAGRAQVIELASAPYGMDCALAAQLGVEVIMEGGVPGRYAPVQAGEALFDALVRAMQTAGTGGEQHG